MRVGILGPVEVVVGGTVVPLGGTRLRALLVRLAADAGRTVTLDALTQALWPETGSGQAPADPAHALQSLVSRLRRAVPGGLPVRAVPGGYRLELPAEAVDVARFESLVRDGRRKLAGGRPGDAAARLREALGLWRGAALADVADAPYAAATAARLDELRLTAIEDRIAADLAGGAAEVVAELHERIAAHPLRERLRVLLLEALRADGRRAEALAAYAEYRALPADELGAEPGPALQEAHLAVLRTGDAPQAPPRGNLRTPLTSFVGRDEERARITDQLSTSRLVTLVGPGGAGKTRLATTLAAELHGTAWLVELAGVSEPADVASAVAGVLGVPEAGRRSWDLLTDDERSAAELLAVFPAAFGTEAAEHLGIAAETLDALVERSLLQLVAGPRVRYRMLETIREYGQERLGRTGRLAQARAAHAGYVLALAERAAPQLRGPDQLQWVRRLGDERDDLLAALQFACTDGDADTAVRLGAALAWFWTVHGEHAEAAHRLRTVLDAVLDVPGVATTATARDVAAAYLFNAVLAGGPARDTGELAALARTADARDPHARMIDALLALIADDTPAGLAAVDAALPHPDPWTSGMLWLTRSFLQGSHAGMTGMWQDVAAAAAAFRAAGERWGLSTTLTYLAVAHSTLGEVDAAAAALRETMSVVRELGTDDFQRVLLASVRIHLGERESARAELQDVVAAARSAGHVAMARVSLADIARHDGDLAEADRQLTLVAAERGGDAGIDPLFRTGRAKLAIMRGELDVAEDDLRAALRLATGMPDMPMAAAVAVGIAQLAARRGAPGSAAEVLGAAHALRSAADAADPDVRALEEDLCRALGERAYRAAYDRGRGANRDAALALIDAQTAAASRSA